MTVSRTNTLFGWIDRRFRPLALVLGVAAIAVAVAGTQMADTDEPSFDPEGEIYETDARAAEVFESTSSIRSASFIVDRADGADVLTRDGLLPLVTRSSQARTDGVNTAHFVAVFDRDLELEIDGIISIADAVDAELAGGLESATDTEVKLALAEVLADDAPTGLLRFTLAQSATAEQGQIDGQRTTVWQASAYKAEVRFDIDTFVGDDDDARQRESELWLRKLQASLRSDEGETRVIGVGIDSLLTSDEQGSAGGPFIFLAVGFIVLLVGALLRSYWAAVVVTSALGLTLLAFNGLLGVLGIKMGSSLISFVIPITLIAFGVDFFIHAAGRVGEEQDESGHRSAGYRTGMAAVFPALTLAAATSIAAFLSNVASGIEAMVQFGIAAAIGLVVAYVTLGWMAPRALVGIGQHVGPGPAPGRFRLARRVLGLVVMVAVALVAGSVVAIAALVPLVGTVAVPLFVVVFVLVPLAVVTRRNRRSRVIGRSTVEGRSHAGHNSAAVGWMVHTAVRWRYLTLALFTGLGAVSLVAATKVESAFKVSDFFSAETDFITGLDRLDHYYGDTIGGPAYIYVEGDLTDPSTIEAMEATIIGLGESDASFARDLDGQLIVLPNAVEVVRATMSIPGAAANASAHTGVAIADEDGDGLPDNPEAVRAVYESGRAIGVVAGDGTVVFTPEQVETFVYLDESAQATKLEVLVTTFTDDAIILDARDVLEEEATRLAGELGPVVKIVSVSGDVIASQDSLAAFTDAMMVSLPIALILTVVIVGLVLRSVRYSTVTILPILLVVFGVWGYMWLRGFTINVVTATIAAIAVGVGIDFCTHFSVRFREELTAGFDRMTAVRRAGEGTGSALAVSAFTSIVGFGVMTAAPAPIFASFGELMAVMIALSALVALLVLPCLLVVVTPAKTTIDAGSPGDDVDLHTEPQTSMPIEGPPIVVMVES